MEKKIITILWRNGGDQITIGEVIAFNKDTTFFIEVNDGKNLTLGVELA